MWPHERAEKMIVGSYTSSRQHKGDVRTIWIRSLVTYASVVHPTWPSWAMWRRDARTFNEWHKKKKTLHMLTHGAMRGCGLTSLVVCINDKFCDIRERNVTIRSDIWTTNIRSLGFWDTRECVTLWRLILHTLGYSMPTLGPMAGPH
jgi:hypothetical protein